DCCVVSWPALTSRNVSREAATVLAEASTFPVNCLQTDTILALSYGDKSACSQRGESSRAALTSPGCYLGPICSVAFSSMRYSERRVAAGSSLILTTLPLK